ncbi:MAG: bifunctional ADP-dependent NAD(P)H-hydrate dehydratase/NAD(P)H-hydrate epimerase [Gammaproteobacteria bacterium]|nr:MAG: bifunctional ADP-dependent NAD(P)H-hydrate dehydratase/NAD(P)H-hydrate epimerase [Gammaproteobacteria bacterium]
MKHPHYYTKQLPASLYTAEKTRTLDRLTIDGEGVPGFELMSRAGQVAFNVLQDVWPAAVNIVVYCGAGNNAGDGYIVASLARRAGLSATVVQVGDPARLKGDALTAYQQAQADQVIMQPFAEYQLQDSDPAVDVVVDALLGTGLAGNVRGNYSDAIAQINQSQLPVLAIDIPSGLCSDSGQVLGTAIKAAATVTFIGVKRGLLTGRGPHYCGPVYYGALAVPEAVYQQVSMDAQRVTADWVRAKLPPRARDAHKGQHGHVLVVGGDLGMGGAAAMAAEAAGRCGAGLVSVITRPEHVAPIIARRPECMVLGVQEGDSIQAALDRASVIVVGPGIGRGRWGAFLLEQVLASDLPVVLDADGLNYLAVLAEQSPHAAERGNWVLTPHPGEASRLLGCRVEHIQQNRFEALEKLVQGFGATVLLKGAGTLVQENAKLPHLVTTGNPGMATGGMGDVLSGVIGALIAQGLSLFDAAAAGAWLHGAAADMAVQPQQQNGKQADQPNERGLLATDLMLPLHQLVNR